MPSKAILEQKQQVVSELSEKIRNSVSGVVVNYQGITVEDDTKLRKELREAGVSYQVVKNTLTGRACEECGYGDIKQYADKIESFTLLAGYCDGEVIDAAAVERLASIPSKETLIAQLLACIQSPLTKFVYVLDQVAKKDEQPAEAAEAPAEA